MEQLSITDQALRDIVREALDGKDWGDGNNMKVANVNAVVDPSAPDTNPISPDFVPQDKVEFGVAMNRLVKNLPDTELPGIYQGVKKELDRRTEKEEEEEMEKQAKQGATQPALTKKETKTEALVRDEVRKALVEAFGDDDQQLEDMADEEVAEEEAEEEETESKPRRGAYKSTAMGSMEDVGGDTLVDMAKEFGFTVSGAKAAIDRALQKLQFLAGMNKDDRQIMVLSTMNDYIEMLNKSGELTPADVRLMKDHPQIISELPGFREFLHTKVRKEMRTAAKTGKKSEAADLDEAQPASPKPGEKIRMTPLRNKVAKPSSAPKDHETKATSALGKGKIDVDWSGLDEGAKKSDKLLFEGTSLVMVDQKGPYVVADGVEVRPRNPNHTQYRAGAKVRCHRYGKKGTFIVEMPNGEKWFNKPLKG